MTTVATARHQQGKPKLITQRETHNRDRQLSQSHTELGHQTHINCMFNLTLGLDNGGR